MRTGWVGYTDKAEPLGFPDGLCVKNRRKSHERSRSCSEQLVEERYL